VFVEDVLHQDCDLVEDSEVDREHLESQQNMDHVEKVLKD
jgi:hypothetical protein